MLKNMVGNAMTDTQWPRYIVFHQEKDGAPHQYAGSVHAADAQMALMNARDVFVRRPNCVSLWVARAEDVLTKTAEEAQQDDAETTVQDGYETLNQYHLFQKVGHYGTLIYAGDVEAGTREAALKAAQVKLPDAKAWWVLPVVAVTRSTAEDIEILFAPAVTKTYRDQASFRTTATIQKLRTQTQEILIDES